MIFASIKESGMVFLRIAMLVLLCLLGSSALPGCVQRQQLTGPAMGLDAGTVLRTKGEAKGSCRDSTLQETGRFGGTFKSVLIGMGTGLLVGTTYSFLMTYDFENGRFTSDPMPLAVTWVIFPPAATGLGGIIGGLIGFQAPKRFEAEKVGNPKQLD